MDGNDKAYGQAKRVWVMGRGIPTEATQAQMRDRNISCLVGTPKGRINKHEKKWLKLEWQPVRDSNRHPAQATGAAAAQVAGDAAKPAFARSTAAPNRRRQEGKRDERVGL